MTGEKQSLRFILIFLSLCLLSSLPSFSAIDSSIELLQPPATHSTSERLIDFRFQYHRGDEGSDTASCNLSLNGTQVGPISVSGEEVGQIRAHGFVVGTYRWSIYCNETLFSENRTLYIDPGEKPAIQLVAPLSGYKGGKAVPFKFVYGSGDDAPQNVTCEFYINDTQVQVLQVISGITYTVEKSDLPAGSYYWYVLCGRGTPYEVKSLFNEFIIRKTTAPVAGGTSPVYLPPVPPPAPPEPIMPSDSSAPTVSSDSSALPSSESSTPPNSSSSNVRLAALSAPALAYSNETLSLRLSRADGSPAAYAIIKVYGPLNYALTTRENGTALFTPVETGNYTYSVPDYSLLSNPKTEVRSNDKFDSGMSIPSLSLLAVSDALPITAAFILLVLLLLALGMLFRSQRWREKEERLLHPTQDMPTGLVPPGTFVAPRSPSHPAPMVGAWDDLSSEPPAAPAIKPSTAPSPDLQMPRDKFVESNPLAPPSLVSIPADKEASTPDLSRLPPPKPPLPSPSSKPLPPAPPLKSSLPFPSTPLPPPPKLRSSFAPLPPKKNQNKPKKSKK